MTILATSLQHFFAGTSRFRRRAHLTPAPASADTTLRIGPELGRRVQQRWPIRNHWRHSAVSHTGKGIPRRRR
jgi:hypothetical protein